MFSVREDVEAMPFLASARYVAGESSRKGPPCIDPLPSGVHHHSTGVREDCHAERESSWRFSTDWNGETSYILP